MSMLIRKPGPSPAPLLALRGVSRHFVGPAGRFCALQQVELEIAAGQLVGIVGRSGSGKSTLLNLVAGLDHPSQGEVWVSGTRVDGLSEDESSKFRGARIGVVFQFFQLLPTLSSLDNVLLPMEFVGKIPRAERLSRALELLARVGVAEQANKAPAALSGGQQQRVAIARALANDPTLIVADEPTGNLDSQTAEAVLELFRALVNEGKTVLLVTHERGIGRRVDRTIELTDGSVSRDELSGPRLGTES
jgi:putative ABC transport system ATP-binding protein